MDIFIAWDVLWHHDDPKFAVLSDDSEKLSRQAQGIDAGKRIWDSWLLQSMGEVIAYDGASGRAKVPSSHVGELADVQERYSQALGNPDVGIGCGMKLSEADEALRVALKRGGDCIVFWTEEVREELSDNKPEDKPLLTKADPPPSPVAPEGPTRPQAQPPENSPAAGGGFAGASQPMDPSTPQAPMQEASEHTQGEGMAAMADAGPSPQEGTHAAGDFEKEFGDHADHADQDDADAKEADEKASGVDRMKAQVVEVLKRVRGQAQALQQLQAVEPQLYAAVAGAIQAMLLMAKGLLSDAPAQKSENEGLVDDLMKADVFFKEAAFRGKDGHVVGTGPFHDIDRIPTGFDIADEGFLGLDGNFYDRSQAAAMVGKEGEAEAKDLNLAKKEPEKLNWRSSDGLKIPHHTNPDRKSWDENYYNKLVEVFANGDRKRLEKIKIPVSDRYSGHWLAPGPVGAGGRDRRPLYMRMLAGGDKLPPLVVRKNGNSWHVIDGNARLAAAVKHGKLKELDAYELKDPVRKEEEPIEKAKLPLPESKPTKHQMVYPVGTQKDASPGGTRDVGRIKTQEPETGKVKWREVRSGMVLSPEGAPVSSRNPGGK